jgi:hypothetical protein
MTKSISLSAFLLMLCAYANATILTVSNFSGSPAMYGSIIQAIDAAAIDDTILIHASGSPYTFENNAGFNKRLVVIGSGWGANAVKIKGYTADCCGHAVNFVPGAEGSFFRGIEFTSLCGISASQLIFQSCRFNPEDGNSSIRTNTPAGCPGFCGGSETSSQDLVFQNCYFNTRIAGLNNDSNYLFENCIFQNFVGANVGLEGNETAVGTFQHTFNHNIFLSDFAVDMSNAVFTNNIFASISSTSIGTGNYCFNCTFENNLTYCASCDLSSISGAILINNLEQQPQPFVNNVADFSQADFNLNDSSLGNDYATDGSDVGVHGGSSPFTPGSNYGSVLLERPIITDFLIPNSIVPQGANLNFQATSTMPNQN